MPRSDRPRAGEGTLVLSLFPGIGLLDMAFEAEGFCVVRGPDLLWGGDVKRFHPPAGKFEGVIGGPPCKAFSRLAHMVKANGYELAEDLIPEFARVVNEARPEWFVMENVPAAPGPITPEYAKHFYLLNNRQFGGVQSRDRKFFWGVKHGYGYKPLSPRVVALEAFHIEPAVTSHCRPTPVKMTAGGRKRTADKPARSLEDSAELQGLPRDFLKYAPFTSTGKREAIGNGVPIPLGRAIALAVREAMYPDWKQEVV